jgi:hypothetical protein
MIRGFEGGSKERRGDVGRTPRNCAVIVVCSIAIIKGVRTLFLVQDIRKIRTACASLNRVYALMSQESGTIALCARVVAIRNVGWFTGYIRGKGRRHIPFVQKLCEVIRASRPREFPLRIRYMQPLGCVRRRIAKLIRVIRNSQVGDVDAPAPCF